MKPKTHRRQSFNFYLSFYDTIELLDTKQIGEFIKIICDVQFFKIHYKNIRTKDKMVRLAWSSHKQSIVNQVLGYCRKSKIDYEALFIEGADTTYVSAG